MNSKCGWHQIKLKTSEVGLDEGSSAVFIPVVPTLGYWNKRTISTMVDCLKHFLYGKMLRVLLNGIVKQLFRVCWTLGSLLTMRSDTETHSEKSIWLFQGQHIRFVFVFSLLLVLFACMCVLWWWGSGVMWWCVNIRRKKFYLFPSLCGIHGSNLCHQHCPAYMFTQWTTSQGQLFLLLLLLWKKNTDRSNLRKEGFLLIHSVRLQYIIMRKLW